MTTPAEQVVVAARALLVKRDERLQCEAALEDIDNPEVRGHATACWTSMLSREENAASALRAALARLDATTAKAVPSDDDRRGVDRGRGVE